MVSTQFWSGLEKAHTLRGVPFYWEQAFGTAHKEASAFLRPVGNTVTRYPCLAPCGMKCRMHVQSRDGRLTAYCPKTPPQVQAVELEPRKAIIHALDMAGVCQVIASLLGIDASTQANQILDNAWYIGSVCLPQGSTAPVYFVMPVTFATVSEAVRDILLRTQEPMMILLPTMNVCDEHTRGLIKNRAGHVFALSDIAREVSGGATNVRSLSSLLSLTAAPMEPGYRFEKVGERWNVRWNGGETKTFNNTLGFNYYLILLENPYIPYSAHDLRILAKRIPDAPRPGMAIEVADREALNEIRREMDDLQHQLAEAETNGDGGAQSLKIRIAELEEHVRTTHDLHERIREEGDEIERARKSVSAAMKEVLKRLRAEEMRDLADHLDAFAPTGTIMKYHPINKVSWNM